MNNSFLNNKTASLQAYIPGDQPEESGWVKLNTNEHAYPPSPDVLHSIKSLDSNELRKYPSPVAAQLKQEIAVQYNLSSDQVLICNGSDEALRMICQATLDENNTAAFPEITYSLYEVLVSAFGSYQKVPMQQNLQVDLNALEQTEANIVFLPNPNAPTGEFIRTERLHEVIQQSKKLWIIDEAYNDFVEQGNSSMLPYIEDLNNLMVTRSFSKSHALAGMRIGFLATADNALFNGLFAIKDSYNINLASQKAALAAVKDKEYHDQQRRKVLETRAYLNKELTAAGWEVLPSEGNFIFASPGEPDIALHIFEKLKENKILVRHFNTEKLSRYLRITIGTPNEIKQLLEVVK